MYCDLTVVLFNNAVHQRHTQAGAFSRIFGGDKGLVNSLEHFRRNAAAVILDVNDDGVVFFVADDLDFTATGHGIPGIAEQVDEHLRQTLLITFDAVVGVGKVGEIRGTQAFG